MSPRDALLAEIAADPRVPESVLAALARVPRDRFVPEALRHRAWDDAPLPIGEGQTISQPSVVALMTALAALRPGDAALDVGTGSGYQAAVLAEVLGLGPGAQGLARGRVATIERVPSLAESARRRLLALGYRSVEFRAGDGGLGWPELAPFDAILCAAATPELPSAWLEQLAPGGRLIAPVGGSDLQQLQVLTRSPHGPRVERGPWVRFVPLIR